MSEVGNWIHNISKTSACTEFSNLFSLRSFVNSPEIQNSWLLCPWGFSRQEQWSGVPCRPPGNLPNPGIEPRSPALQVVSLSSEPPGKPSIHALMELFVNFFVQKCLWDSFTLLHKSRIRSFSWLHEIPSLVQQVLVTHYLDDHLYFSQFGATMSKVVMYILTHVSQCIRVLPSLMHDWIKRLYSFSTSPDNDNTLKN